MPAINVSPGDKYADMRILTSADVLLVHSNVVCPRSSVFENYFEIAEGGPVVIDLAAENAQVVSAMVSSMYHGDYEVPVDRAAVSFQADVLTFAEKYRIAELMSDATSRFYFEASLCWRTDEFLELFENAYTGPNAQDSRMRKMATGIAKSHATEIMGGAEGFQRFRQVIEGIPSLNRTFAQASMTCRLERIATNDTTRTPRFVCPRCQGEFEADVPAGEIYEHACP